VPAASGTPTSRRILRRRKGVWGQPSVRFDPLPCMTRSCNSSGVKPPYPLTHGNLGRYLHRNLRQHPSRRLQGIVAYRRSPRPGLRTVRNLCRNPGQPGEASGGASRALFYGVHPVGAPPNLKRVAHCGTVSVTLLLP
jgi:hypothetical protein